MSTTNYDVIVAGAGPVGLFLACELRLAGCSVLVLEKEASPDAASKQLPFGLRGLNAPSIETLDRRDLLAPLAGAIAAGIANAPAHRVQPAQRAGGHFAGIPFFIDRADPNEWPWRRPDAPTNLAAALASIETVFAERALATGVAILRGFPLDVLEQAGDHVVVGARGRSFSAAWLVGCDGGRSVVRKLAGIPFAGTEPEFTGYSVQATFGDPGMLDAGRHLTATGMYTFTPPDTLTMLEFDGGACHRAVELTRAHVEAVLRRVSGRTVELRALHTAATWTDRAFLAGTYRHGRILLAGDAAHVHSPLGGQGFNLGLGDAVNLGWKLAATIQGRAPAGLLDSYEGERRALAATILDWSRAQVALLRPAPASRALRAIVTDLAARGSGATYFAERVCGIGQRYDLGGSHMLVGRSAPDIPCVEGSLATHLRRGQGLLLDATGSEALRHLAESFDGAIAYVAMTGPGAHARALLVRPDGIVAWASEADPNPQAAAAAAAQWFMPQRSTAPHGAPG